MRDGISEEEFLVNPRNTLGGGGGGRGGREERSGEGDQSIVFKGV